MVHIPGSKNSSMSYSSVSGPSRLKVINASHLKPKVIVNKNSSSKLFTTNAITNGASLISKTHILSKPIQVLPKAVINPLNVKKKVQNSTNILVSGNSNISFNKVQKKNSQDFFFKKLPPGLTITRTSSAVKRTQPLTPVLSKKKKIQKVNSNMCKVNNPMEICTVDLDDDDEALSSTTKAHSWYLRPEDQIIDENKTEIHIEVPPTNISEENTKEPESNLIEITIEDSPVKTIPDKRIDTTKEMSITIDDSPVKLIDKSKGNKATSSEDENKKIKTPLSKKKLLYPEDDIVKENIASTTNEISSKNNETESNDKTESVEKNENPRVNNKTPVKELELVPTESICNDNVIILGDTPIKVDTDDIPARESISIKNKEDKIDKMDILNKETYTKSDDSSSKVTMSPAKETKKLNVTNNHEEFHPEYQKFIDLCFKFENSNDMKKIVEKKIKGYYRQVPKEYTESEAFIEMIMCKTSSMKASPYNTYLHIKDVVDELKSHRKVSKPGTQLNKDVKGRNFHKKFNWFFLQQTYSTSKVLIEKNIHNFI